MSWILTSWPYAVPFRSALETARGASTVRYGAIIALTANDGLVGLGEVACLPDRPIRLLFDALRILQSCAEQLAAGSSPAALLARWASWDEAGRAARAALEGAWYDYQAHEQQQALATLLNSAARSTVPVNAVIAARDRDSAAIAAARARTAGFQVVKVKVGMDNDEAEIARVAAVRDALGSGITLRLDANGAWTSEQAIRLLHRLSHYDIALIEQPTPPHDLAALAAVRRAVPIPVAADEAVTNPVVARQILLREAADVLVLKLPVIGGIEPAWTIAELAERHQCAVLVTSVFEAGVGLATALHVAAALPGSVLACGLATANSLAASLVHGLPHPERGFMPLPPGLGLGVTLDWNSLNTFGWTMEELRVVTSTGK